MDETDLDFPRAQWTKTTPSSWKALSISINIYVWNQQLLLLHQSRIIRFDLQDQAWCIWFLRFQKNCWFLRQHLQYEWLYFFKKALFDSYCSVCPLRAILSWYGLHENFCEYSFIHFRSNVHIFNIWNKSTNFSTVFPQLNYNKTTWFCFFWIFLGSLQFLLQFWIYFFLQRT